MIKPTRPPKALRPGPTHGDFPIYEVFPQLGALMRYARANHGAAPLVAFRPRRERVVPASWRFYPAYYGRRRGGGTRPAWKGEAPTMHALSLEAAGLLAQRLCAPRKPGGKW